MHLTPLNFTLVVTGLVIYILIKLVKIQKKRPEQFDIRVYFKHNYIQIILSTICAFVVMYFANLFTDAIKVHVHHDSYFYELFALAAGYNNPALLNDLMKKNT